MIVRNVISSTEAGRVANQESDRSMRVGIAFYVQAYVEGPAE